MGGGNFDEKYSIFVWSQYGHTQLPRFLWISFNFLFFSRNSLIACFATEFWVRHSSSAISSSFLCQSVGIRIVNTLVFSFIVASFSSRLCHSLSSYLNPGFFLSFGIFKLNLRTAVIVVKRLSWFNVPPEDFLFCKWFCHGA